MIRLAHGKLATMARKDAVMQCRVAVLRCCSVAVLQCLLQLHWHGALARSTPTTFVLCVNANSSHNKKRVPELKSEGGGGEFLMS